MHLKPGISLTPYETKISNFFCPQAGEPSLCYAQTRLVKFMPQHPSISLSDWLQHSETTEITLSATEKLLEEMQHTHFSCL